jgi:glycosyltransferase involved in cell wall biosynthesis
MHTVSVIVPIYNVNAYLFQCVQSIVSQTYSALEIILVNDGSTDNCAEICEYFRKTDTRVQVITQANGGLVNARQSGIEYARGEWVLFVDGDDWLEFDYIQQMITAQHSCAADLVIPAHLREFMGLKSVIMNPLLPGFYDRDQIESLIFPQLISYQPFYQPGIFTYSWGKLFKRTQVLPFQLQTPEALILGEDAAVVYPLIAGAKSLIITNVAGYNYRQRPNSILKTVTDIDNELNKLRLLRNHLRQALATQTSFDFSSQLDDFIFAYSLMRTGAFLDNQKLRALTNIPQDIPVGSRICLYNSGSFGQQVYKSVNRSHCYEIVAWVDEDYSESQLIGLPVVDPKSLNALNFDFILIAILDPLRSSEIKKSLAQLNIDSSRIITPQPNSISSSQALEILGLTQSN